MFESPFDSRVLFKLNHLLHVPSVTKILFSVSQFAKDNFVFFEFHSDKCLVKSQGSNKVLLHGGVGPDGLYSFHNIHLFSQSNHRQSPYMFSVASPSFSATLNHVNKVVSDNTSVHLWHTRLGHPNSHIMHLVFKYCNLSFPNKVDHVFCQSCCAGKSHRLPSHDSKFVYSPLELIFTDLCGPAHITSHIGFKYYVTFVDAFSRYTWIFPIKTKNETLSVFQTFKQVIELQLNCKIKQVQSDWGGEFRPFTNYLAHHGIFHRLICPHAHHQNGVIEHKHRHIIELGLTLLHQASLPMYFWDYAFTNAVYLINRLRIVSLQFVVSFSVLFHKYPDYHFLKTFGCSCFPLL